MAFQASEVMLRRLEEIDRRYVYLTEQLSQASDKWAKWYTIRKCFVIYHFAMWVCLQQSIQ
jgi:hypothetical protein